MKVRNPEASCKSCPFWDTTLSTDPDAGLCVQGVPQVVIRGDKETGRFPRTKSIWVCSNHPEFLITNTPEKSQ